MLDVRCSIAFIGLRSPRSAPPVLRRDGSIETIAMRRRSCWSSRKRRTISSVSELFAAPPVPVIPSVGVFAFAARSAEPRASSRQRARLECRDHPGRNSRRATNVRDPVLRHFLFDRVRQDTCGFGSPVPHDVLDVRNAAGSGHTRAHRRGPFSIPATTCISDRRKAYNGVRRTGYPGRCYGEPRRDTGSAHSTRGNSASAAGRTMTVRSSRVAPLERSLLSSCASAPYLTVQIGGT